MKRKKIPIKALPPNPNSLIFLAYRGSKSFGTYQKPTEPNSTDDIDLIGCYVNPINGYFGFNKTIPEHYAIMSGKWDCVYYEFRKMIALLAKGNPNVLASLWLPDRHIIYKHPMWDQIIGHKKLFVSKNVYSAFSGYANDQLKKMTHLALEGYMGPKRRELVKKYGYDTKNAAHLIRLLRMGNEFLQTGELQVDRTNIDRDQLLAIKNGGSPLGNIKTLANRLFKIGRNLKRSSKIKNECDIKTIENLMIFLLMKHFQVGDM